jgi:site-specific recombinase XerD
MSEKTSWSTEPTAHPPLSTAGQEALCAREYWLREREDLTPASIRNYPSDLHHCTAWYETDREAQVHDCFSPQEITTSALTGYRAYLQTVQRQKPASVNRSLISLKRYFGWASQQHFTTYDPSVAVKLVGQVESALRHLDDQVEQALVAAATSPNPASDDAVIHISLITLLAVKLSS